MSTYSWPNEDGWPYPDVESEPIDLDAEVDDDALMLRATPPHLFDDLEPLERRVVVAHYGLDGTPAKSMKQLHHELGMNRAEVRDALAGGLAKLRLHLNA